MLSVVCYKVTVTGVTVIKCMTRSILKVINHQEKYDDDDGDDDDGGGVMMIGVSDDND